MKTEPAAPVVNDQRDVVVCTNLSEQSVQILKSDLKAVAVGAVTGW